MKKLPMNTRKVINKIESEQLKSNIPDFKSGDTISVHLLLTENNKTRIQKITGVCLRRRGNGLNETFILRKIGSNNIGVEFSYQLHSPKINKIEIIKAGKVRRSYISYIRNLSGKDARIKPSNKAN